MIVKVRLGSEEEHREWDSREKLRPMLEEAVKVVLGEEDQLESIDSRKFIEKAEKVALRGEDYEAFIFALLCEDAVIKALRGRKMGL